jgi:hypothetical protein
VPLRIWVRERNQGVEIEQVLGGMRRASQFHFPPLSPSRESKLSQ